jgi:hypothetical protein
MFLIAFVFIAFLLVTTLTRLLLIARLADTFGTRCPLVPAGRAVVLYFIYPLYRLADLLWCAVEFYLSLRRLMARW